MFQSVKRIGYRGNYVIYYEVVDSEFREFVDVPYRIAETARGAFAVIIAYERRSINVAKNLALYYSHNLNYDINNAQEQCHSDKYLLDRYFAPHLEFGKKYYKCTLNHIRMFGYGKRKYNN